MAADHAYPLDMALCTYASLLLLRDFCPLGDFRRWRAYFRRKRAYVGHEEVGVEGFFVVFRPSAYFRREAPTLDFRFATFGAVRLRWTFGAVRLLSLRYFRVATFAALLSLSYFR